MTHRSFTARMSAPARAAALAALLAALAAHATGCGSTTQPNTTPPQVAGQYAGAAVIFLTPGAVVGDTLDATLTLTQTGATVGGSWSIALPAASKAGTDSAGALTGTVTQGRLVETSTTAGTWQLQARLQVNRAGCSGGFDVLLDYLPDNPGLGPTLLGSLSGSSACFRGGTSLSGVLGVFRGGSKGLRGTWR